MKNIYDGILAFQGQWRSYQERVLRESNSFLSDGKIHIVAAPGAGKTTLGIELIRQAGKPCLILSPRIVIRQQWLERIRSSFLTAAGSKQKEDTERKLLSYDIRYPGLITSITYQTLYSAMSGKKSEEETGEEGRKEEVDFTGFRFMEQVKSAGIGTVCLDECHHLRSEWWKALEKFMEEMSGMTVIALTATPPYDSTPAQWKRYIEMCGPVDAEITVPELVKEGSLCPHQDYVWFNCPSSEEEEQIHNFRSSAADMYEFLMTDRNLKDAAATHPSLNDYEHYFDHMLENPGYLSGLLTYCHAVGISYSHKWTEVLGIRQMPLMSEKWMEYFLQGFLYDDVESYQCPEKYRDILERQLREAGLISGKKITFLVNDRIEKMLINSRGKLDSILRIASCEHTSMGKKLRMLILTDYIRGEYRNVIGNPKKDVAAMGVLPVFEMLRRRGAGWRLGVLCGSMIIIPDTAIVAFAEELEHTASGQSPELRKLTDHAGTSLGYSEVTVNGHLGIYMRVMTKIFERGYIQILIGTKSLLGEGWDSPGINSLVMASTVGSYVLGNQMRGRAIRICPWDPDKVSNIWHLVCMSTPGEEAEKRRMGIEMPELSEDFRILERRMDGVLGVSYDGSVIENGIQRLQNIRKPLHRKHIMQINDDMARRSADRATVAAQWKKAVSTGGRIETADEYRTDKKRLQPGVMFFHALGAQIMITLVELLNIIRNVILRPDISSGYMGFFVITALFILLSIVFGGKLIRQLTPMWRFRGISRGILKALQRSGQITSPCEAVSQEDDGICFYAWLKGGTDREKNVYADTLADMLAPADNQRYLLCHGGRQGRAKEYFCVPAVFAASREKAEMFQKELEPYIGKFRLVYTRNPEGRQILLHARARAFANRNERRMDRKKQMKGMLE